MIIQVLVMLNRLITVTCLIFCYILIDHDYTKNFKSLCGIIECAMAGIEIIYSDHKICIVGSLAPIIIQKSSTYWQRCLLIMKEECKTNIVGMMKMGAYKFHTIS